MHLIAISPLAIRRRQTLHLEDAHQRTSLEDAELAAFFELVGDAGLDTFFLSERYNGINRVDESVSDDRTNMHH